jgi:hypothetical protein
MVHLSNKPVQMACAILEVDCEAISRGTPQPSGNKL